MPWVKSPLVDGLKATFHQTDRTILFAGYLNAQFVEVYPELFAVFVPPNDEIGPRAFCRQLLGSVVGSWDKSA